jgi:hypothetical protein
MSFRPYHTPSSPPGVFVGWGVGHPEGNYRRSLLGIYNYKKENLKRLLPTDRLGVGHWDSHLTITGCKAGGASSILLLVLLS